MEPSPHVCTLIRKTADAFFSARRRQFMARTLRALGLSQRQAQRAFGGGRDTLRKAQHEARSGITCHDATSARGRKPAEFHLPRLLDAIRAIAPDHCQTDPKFQTTRLYGSSGSTHRLCTFGHAVPTWHKNPAEADRCRAHCAAQRSRRYGNRERHRHPHESSHERA